MDTQTVPPRAAVEAAAAAIQATLLSDSRPVSELLPAAAAAATAAVLDWQGNRQDEQRAVLQQITEAAQRVLALPETDPRCATLAALANAAAVADELLDGDEPGMAGGCRPAINSINYGSCPECGAAMENRGGRWSRNANGGPIIECTDCGHTIDLVDDVGADELEERHVACGRCGRLTVDKPEAWHDHPNRVCKYCGAKERANADSTANTGRPPRGRSGSSAVSDSAAGSDLGIPNFRPGGCAARDADLSGIGELVHNRPAGQPGGSADGDARKQLRQAYCAWSDCFKSMGSARRAQFLGDAGAGDVLQLLNDAERMLAARIIALRQMGGA